MSHFETSTTPHTSSQFDSFEEEGCEHSTSTVSESDADESLSTAEDTAQYGEDDRDRPKTRKRRRPYFQPRKVLLRRCR